MLQISRNKFIEPSLDELEDFRRAFAAQNYVLLPKLFDESVLAYILKNIEISKFQSRSDVGNKGEFASELTVESTTPVVHFFNLLLNNFKLFNIIEQITNCEPIGNFLGRFYRMLPNSGHYDSWHDDMGNFSLVTLSVNFSPQIYEGGMLEMRYKDSAEIFAMIHNTGLGDGLLFRLSEDLCHRVSRIEGDKAKTAGAGQFRSTPHFLKTLKGEVDWEKRSK
jgi:hypothetical protein